MDRLDSVIHEIYNAAREPEYWTSVARDVAAIAGGHAVHLLLSQMNSESEILSLFSRDESGFAQEYLKEYAAEDFRVPRVMARPLGVFADEREYVSASESRSSPIHQELLPRHEVYNISGANLCIDGHIGWFGISTASPSLEFDNRQRSMLGMLSRHLLGAFQITALHNELKLSRDHSRGSLDLLADGLVLTRSGTVVHVNDAAQRLIEQGLFSISGGRLRCRDSTLDRRLAAVEDQARDRSQAMLLQLPDLGTAYMVSVHDVFPRYRDGALRASGYEAISIVELNHPFDIKFEDVLAFCAPYGITSAEASAVHASLNSVSLSEHARTRHVGLSTVQQQLKSALAKMGLQTQKKLFRAFERYRNMGASRKDIRRTRE